MPPTDAASGVARPVIGVCAAYEKVRWSFWDMDAAVVASTYLRHIAEADAVPLALIPSAQTEAEAEALIARVDGLLLLGGADISPGAYGQMPVPELEQTVPLRDESEIALARAARAAGIPVLGICRGLHLLNVATGGTLIQDIGELGPGRHRAAYGRLDESTHHGISVAAGSVLASVVGEGAQTVNSHHHQAVDRLGDGGVVSAVCEEDGVIEAVEWDPDGFTVGVQWHPEAMEPGGIIAAFIDAVWERKTRGARVPARSGAI